MAPRPNSKIQPKNGVSPMYAGQKSSTVDSESAEQNSHLLAEIDNLNQQLSMMKKLLAEKDKIIENQRTDLTNLRKKNFEFRSKV